MNLFHSQHYLREATAQDKQSLQIFLNKTIYLHQHLDWRSPLDWLGWQPFWLAEKDHQILGILASPADPSHASWIRIFAADLYTSPSRIFGELLEKNVEWHKEKGKSSSLACLGLSDWFIHILQDLQFVHHQDVVMMIYDRDFATSPSQNLTHGNLREMRLEDLPAVTEVDNSAFEPMWQLSETDLYHAFQKTSYKTLIEVEGKIIAYQMSTESDFKAHLARIAVSPTLQNQGLGTRLIMDALYHFIVKKGLNNVTLNTQSTNKTSLHVYQRCGFRLTGEQFPVFIYPLE